MGSQLLLRMHGPVLCGLRQHYPCAAATPAWPQHMRHCAVHRRSRGLLAVHAVGDGNDANVAAPGAGSTGSDLQSHPLGEEPLPGPHNDSVETRAEGDFDSDAGMTIEAGDDASAGAFSASSSQATAVAAEPASPPPARSLLDRVPGGRAGRLGAVGLAGFLGLTVVIALVRAGLKFRSPKAQRIRKVNNNKRVVETLNRYLPQDRAGFGKGEARALKMRTRFSGTEIFRKYLWYLLRERSFDVDAVADMQQLKESLGLSDEEVQEALKERAQRIYKEYGNVMLNTEGMTKTGIDRKATTKALFSKLLYLAESEELLPSADAATRRSLVADVFGATEDDAAQLRIVSLYEVDAGRVEELASEPFSYPEDPDAEE